MNKYQVCSRCRFWLAPHKSGSGGFPGFAIRKRRAKRGQCHRYAPRAQALSPQWPWTKAMDTCGEFEPRPDEHRALDAREPIPAGGPESGSSALNG
jgi:hypothetical protein